MAKVEIDAHLNDQIDQAQIEHLGATERLQHTPGAVIALVMLLGRYGRAQLRLLSIGEPLRITGLVVEVPVGPDADDGRQQAFDQEHPLPAREASNTVHFEQEARQRAAEDEGERGAKVTAQSPWPWRTMDTSRSDRG